MVNRTLFIHIGWHKTATSLVQLYLDENRAPLRQRGVCYPVIVDRPDWKEIKHSYLFLSVLNKLGEPHAQKDLAICDFDELFELSIRELEESGCPCAIISEEGLSQATPGIAPLMGRYLKYFDKVVVVAYVRRQDYFLESLYAQFVKQKPERITLRFDEYIRRPEVVRRADYALVLGWWADVFGRENIMVTPFEEHVVKPDPISFFFTRLGLPTDMFEQAPVAGGRVHVTPPREVIEFFRYLNMRKNSFFVKVLCEYLTEYGGPTTNARYFSRADREKILQRYSRSNREVAEKYLQKKDGVLFEEPVSDIPNCAVTWNGLSPEEILEYALPVCGRMSDEIARLRHRVSALELKLHSCEHEKEKSVKNTEWLERWMKIVYHRALRLWRMVRDQKT